MALSYTDGEKAIGTPFMRENLTVMSKIICVFTLSSAIVYLRIDLKDILIKTAKDDVTSLFIVAVFVIARVGTTKVSINRRLVA